jgi:hypothetical protein
MNNEELDINSMIRVIQVFRSLERNKKNYLQNINN